MGLALSPQFPALPKGAVANGLLQHHGLAHIACHIEGDTAAALVSSYTAGMAIKERLTFVKAWTADSGKECVHACHPAAPPRFRAEHKQNTLKQNTLICLVL